MENDQRDIVSRLRYQHVRVDIQGSWLNAETALEIARDAADEIERLRGRLQDLLDYPPTAT